MTTRWMRAIDRFAGIPLCLAAGLMFSLPRRRVIPRHHEALNILVIKFFGLGSILLSTPFLAALRLRHPRARIYFLSFSANRELLERIPEVNVPLSIANSSVPRFVLDSIRTLALLRAAGIDRVYDLEFFSKFSTILSVLSGSPVRIGYALPTRWRRWNLTAQVPIDHREHVTQTFLRQLSAEAAAPPAEIPAILSLSPSPADSASMEHKLHLSRTEVVPICINVNAGQTSLERRWSPDRFAAVARHLLTRSDSVRLFFTGNAAERAYVRTLLAGHPDLLHRSVNCAGRLSMGELLALLAHSRLLITNDSGPMHLACSVGTPTLALFGPESPRFYGPGARATSIYKAIGCSPCMNVYTAKAFSCPFNAQCMNEISVEEVMTAADALLDPQPYACIEESVG